MKFLKACANSRPRRCAGRNQKSTGVQFINDAYNANPLSMRAGLRTFRQLPGIGKKWAVIGGMRELGTTTDEEHASLGEFIDGLDLDGVITVGELGRRITCKQTHFPAAKNRPRRRKF